MQLSKYQQTNKQTQLALDKSTCECIDTGTDLYTWREGSACTRSLIPIACLIRTEWYMYGGFSFLHKESVGGRERSKDIVGITDRILLGQVYSRWYGAHCMKLVPRRLFVH